MAEVNFIMISHFLSILQVLQVVVVNFMVVHCVSTFRPYLNFLPQQQIKLVLIFQTSTLFVIHAWQKHQTSHKAKLIASIWYMKF